MKLRKFLRPVAAVLLVLLQVMLQNYAEKTAAENRTLGVTFSEPLTAAQTADARTWEQSDANTAQITASYWSSKKSSVKSDFGHIAEKVTCIGFDGTASDCLPAEYLQGTAPGCVGQQCAVSAGLAWVLFGSNEIIGQCVTLDKTQYYICGVFGGKNGILLYPAQSGFTHAELNGISEDTPKTDAEQWAAASGVGTIQSIDYGPQKAWLIQTLSALPAAAVGLCLLVILLRRIGTLPPMARDAVCFVLALAFACRLPHFLQTLPGWLVPTRWSDFSFWPNLWNQMMQK
ncbi:hypothetical protein [Gemmiger sp.]